jgi:hypothetical protein
MRTILATLFLFVFTGATQAQATVPDPWGNWTNPNPWTLPTQITLVVFTENGVNLVNPGNGSLTMDYSPGRSQPPNLQVWTTGLLTVAR